MLFNSLEFAVFFPAVVALYFAMPQRGRTHLLLAASCLFYMAFIPAYIAILALTIAIDYAAGIWLERTTGRTRRALLVISIVSTCAVLFVFKYFDFFTDSFVGIARLLGWELHSPALAIILPIGLSFHTFQSLSYVIEVYYGRQKAEPDFVTYATYVMFFPQLVAGPDREATKSVAPVLAEARVRLRTHHKWPQANGVGLFQETGHCRPPRAIRERRLCGTVAVQRPPADDSDGILCLSDLL